MEPAPGVPFGMRKCYGQLCLFLFQLTVWISVFCMQKLKMYMVPKTERIYLICKKIYDDFYTLKLVFFDVIWGHLKITRHTDLGYNTVFAVQVFDFLIFIFPNVPLFISKKIVAITIPPKNW